MTSGMGEGGKQESGEARLLVSVDVSDPDIAGLVDRLNSLSGAMKVADRLGIRHASSINKETREFGANGVWRDVEFSGSPAELKRLARLLKAVQAPFLLNLEIAPGSPGVDAASPGSSSGLAILFKSGDEAVLDGLGDGKDGRSVRVLEIIGATAVVDVGVAEAEQTGNPAKDVAYGIVPASRLAAPQDPISGEKAPEEPDDKGSKPEEPAKEPEPGEGEKVFGIYHGYGYVVMSSADEWRPLHMAVHNRQHGSGSGRGYVLPLERIATLCERSAKEIAESRGAAYCGSVHDADPARNPAAKLDFADGPGR